MSTSLASRSPYTGIRIQHNTYDKLFTEQRGCCACCGDPEHFLDEHGDVRKLIVYFNVSTGTIKGLICARCVMGLHLFNDSAETLSRAITFLSHGNNARTVHTRRAELVAKADQY